MLRVNSGWEWRETTITPLVIGTLPKSTTRVNTLASVRKSDFEKKVSTDGIMPKPF